MKIFQKIKIAIGVTGNELILRSGSQLQLGKIYDSNSMLLCQLCKEHGFEIAIAENIPDRLEDTRNFLFAAAEHADVLLTTGGISMGDRDFIKLFLEKPTHTHDKTHTVHFQGVSLKPGKPFTFAHIQQKNAAKKTIPLLSMPGNPLSVFITYLYFVLPFSHTLSGKENNSIAREKMQSPHAFSPYPRTRFLFGIKEHTKTNATITILEDQSSASIKNLRNADGALIIPADTAVEQNEQVDFFPFHHS